MHQDFRNTFNDQFSNDKYQSFLESIHQDFPGVLDFRIAETPIFLTDSFVEKCTAAGDEIIDFIVRSDFKKQTEKAIPEGMFTPNEDDCPQLLSIDFAISRNEAGELTPYLIELQGFATLFNYQSYLAEKYVTHFNIPDTLTPFFNGLNRQEFLSLLKNTLLAEFPAEEVILLELFPDKQKTRIDEHHIFLLETISEKQFIDKYHQKELVTSTKISGIQDPSLLLAATNSENFTIYEKFIKIAGSQYINPMNKNTFRRYNFEIIDTIPEVQCNDTLLLIKFSQKGTKNFKGLKGFLYVSKQDFAVKYFTASPMLHSSFEKKIYQSYGKLSNGKWFPLQTNSFLSFGKFGSSKGELFLCSKKINTNILINKNLGKQYFNEYIFEYHSGYNIDNDAYWEENRMDYLSPKDLNTYLLYDSINKRKSLDKFIDIGHKLYYGQLPLNKINIDLNRIFSFNDYEKFRTGFGFHTNEKLFKNFTTGAYFGYGTRDEKFKYGGDFSIIINKETDFSLNFKHSKDLSESGITNWAFNEYLYSSERLRKYRVLMKDWETRSEVNCQVHPIKYLNLQLGIVQTNKTTTYAYQYASSNSFNFLESILGVRYAYREQFVKTENTKISKGSNYPIVYFNFTHSFATNAQWGEFEYNKYDLRIDKIFNTLNFGHSTIQLKMGYIDNAKIPYMNLYNISGSNNNKDLTFVTHNSFMTMGYNEFAANQYLNLFYNHNFGRFYARDRFFNPEIELIANMGWGTLLHADLHQEIKLKSIEKGYYESGLNMNNILNVNLVGLNIGIGVGFFYRMGPYTFQQQSQNLITKVTTNFYF
ncbi:MAG: hypothetical protein RL711_1582 [Bacteroidota bacterium]